MADKNEFFSLLLAKKYSKNKNFNTVLGHLVAIYVYNMWFKFHKNRFTGFEDIVETVRKNVVLRKTRLNFFLMKKSYLKLICDACTQYFWIHILSKKCKKKSIFRSW